MKATIDVLCPWFFKGLKNHIEASPLGYRLAKGAFWSLAGSLISRGLGLISAIGVARLLGKHEFGQLSMIQSTVGMFGAFAGFGMGITANKHVAEFRVSDPARAGRIIGVSSIVAWCTGSLMTVGLVIFAPWIAAKTLADPAMAGDLRLGSFLLLLGGVNGAQTGALSGFEAFRTIARVNLLSGLLSFPLTVGGAWRFGLPGAIGAAVASVGLNCVLNYRALRQVAARARVPLSFRRCHRELRLLWDFSLPAVLSSASVVPMQWAANALLANQPAGYPDLGVLYAANRIKQLPETVYSVAAAPVVPVMSERFGSGDAGRYHKTFAVSLYLSALIIVPLALLQTAVPWLTLAAYGKDYAGHSGLVHWLMLHSLIIGVLIPLGNVLISMGKMWLALTFQVLLGVGFLLFGWLLVPRYRAEGLAATIALAQAASSLVCVAYLCVAARGFFRVRPLKELTVYASLLFVICLVANRVASMPVAAVAGAASAAVVVLVVIRGIRRQRVA